MKQEKKSKQEEQFKETYGRYPNNDLEMNQAKSFFTRIKFEREEKPERTPEELKAIRKAYLSSR